MVSALPLLSFSCSWREARAISSRHPPDAALVAEALEVLQRIETSGSEASLEQIENLRRRYGQDSRCAVVESLLMAWAEARCQAERPAAKMSPLVTTVQEILLEGPPAAKQSVVVAEELKNKGIGFYSEGNLEAALPLWHEALEHDPGDDEVKQLIRRAETVLSKRAK